MLVWIGVLYEREKPNNRRIVVAIKEGGLDLRLCNGVLAEMLTRDVFRTADQSARFVALYRGGSERPPGLLDRVLRAVQDRAAANQGGT